MELSNKLKKPSINLIDIVRNFNKRQLTKDINSILAKDYEELMKNTIYLKNYLELVSYVYAREHLSKERIKKDTISTEIFNKNLQEKFRDLRNSYVHTISISR